MRPRFRLMAVTAALSLLLGAGSAAADGGPIMPLSQVHGGMDCMGETVIQGTTISSFAVHVIDVVQEQTEGPRILVSVSGPAVAGTGLAEGFSGSPVYCPDAMGTMRIIGAVSEGIGQYGNNVGLLTPIQAMLGEPVRPPSAAPRLAVRARALTGPLTVAGLSPSVAQLLSAAGTKVGRSVVFTPGGGQGVFPLQPLVPGASVAAQYSSGDVSVGAIGTVTYRAGSTVYAFGHPLDDVGRRSLLLQDAYVYYVVADPNVTLDTSYKLAVPGQTEGTLTADESNAIVGVVGAPPPTIPVDVAAHDLDTGRRLTLHSDVASETDIGSPLGSTLVDIVAPLQIAQAVSDIYDGAPASESGRLCLSVTLRELSRPLSFCNRYVSTGAPSGSGTQSPPVLGLLAAGDLTTGLSLIDAVQFANLHVTRLSASIDAARGLRQGTIVSAAGPKRVRAGQTVRVLLRVRRYKAGLRTVSITMRIPRGTRGRLVARISNPSEQAAQNAASSALVSALASALGGTAISVGSGSSPAPPASLAALRQQFSAIAQYDGLQVKFGDGSARHVYRDPNLLINGSARLVFQVAR